MNDEDRVGCGLAVLAILIVAVLAIRVFYIDNECTKLGYRDSSMTWTTAAYCIRRVDQTDIVIPLDSARRLRK